MKRYAVINDKNICTNYAETSSEIIADNYIELKDGEVVEIGYIWDGEKWNEPVSEPVPEQPLSEQEQIAIDKALNVEYIACLLEASLT